MNYWLIPLTIIVCYFIGNINFALLISRIIKRDIRKADSGNPGAMNMARNYGTGIGALTLLLDVGKGVAGAILGWFMLGEGQLFSFGDNKMGMLIGGVSVVVGHIFPVVLKFKGGKGISSTIGVCFVIYWQVTLIAFVIGVILLLITKIGAITSFIVITPPLALFAFWAATDTANPSKIVIPILCLFLFILTFWAHRGNVKRLFTGTENKTRLIKKRSR